MSGDILDFWAPNGTPLSLTNQLLAAAPEDPLRVREDDLVPLPLVCRGDDGGVEEAAAPRPVRVRPQPRLALGLVFCPSLALDRPGT